MGQPGASRCAGVVMPVQRSLRAIYARGHLGDTEFLSCCRLDEAEESRFQLLRHCVVRKDPPT